MGRSDSDLKMAKYCYHSKLLKKKAIVITSDPLALVIEQTKVSKRKEKVVVSSDSDRSDDELKKITELLAKAFNRKKFYSKPTNNNLRTSSTTSSANKKQEYVKSNDKKEEKKDCKKAKIKDYEYYKTKMMLAKKEKDEQVLLAEDHAWMESSSDSDQEINANMVFMVQIEKVLSDSKASSSSADDKIAERFAHISSGLNLIYASGLIHYYGSGLPVLRDRLPMLATRRYAQWQSCFLRYIDPRANGDALRKCIIEGPYIPSTVTIPAVPTTDDTLIVLE
nr:hypothetical protein [Tanacetum cinerariifolium]